MGGAYSFASKDGAYLVADKPAATTSKNFAVSMWIKADSAATYGDVGRVIYSESNSGNTVPLFCLNAHGEGNVVRIRVYLRNAEGKTLANVTSTNTFPVGEWAQVKFISQNGKGTVEINGQTESFDFPAEIIPADRTAIGAIVRDPIANTFDGAIDEVEVKGF